MSKVYSSYRPPHHVTVRWEPPFGWGYISWTKGSRNKSWPIRGWPQSPRAPPLPIPAPNHLYSNNSKLWKETSRVMVIFASRVRVQQQCCCVTEKHTSDRRANTMRHLIRLLPHTCRPLSAWYLCFLRNALTPLFLLKQDLLNTKEQ